MRDLKTKILNVIEDTMTNLLYYDRKEDYELGVGDLERAIEEGVITVDEILEQFKKPFMHIEKLPPKEEEPLKKASEFNVELRALLNRFSKENGSDTPDYILAYFLEGVLKVYDETLQMREKWYGREKEALSNLSVEASKHIGW
jgi:hypothetical protein